MQLIKHRAELTRQLTKWRGCGDRIALVATMGNLHAGHLSLVKFARDNADRVVVTVFVNPMQFGAGEDFASYPRSLERDTQRLKKVRTDVLFAPEIETVYPFGIENATRVSVPGLTDGFCGSSRPGHFDGVTTVVTRLFTLSQPDIAVFGQKDYQQLLVVRRLVEDLGLSIEIVGRPIIREADGLALSSRNAYLSDEERRIAPALYQQLHDVGNEVRTGARNYDNIAQRAISNLKVAGLMPEYFAIRRSRDLRVPDLQCDEFVVLAAALVGKVRLIDNVTVTSQ